MDRSSAARGLMLASGVAETDTLGRRNQRILALRGDLFGAHVASLARCPACGGDVEVSFSAAELRGEAGETGEHALERDGYDVRFRLPNSLDLAYLRRCADEDEAERALLERCVVGVRRGQETVSLDRVPAAVIDALDARMDELDPGACHVVGLECPDCSHRWSCLFDVAAFVWRELEAAAKTALRQVHGLAATYGWTEAEVLRLSPRRRLMYLELTRQ
jgi:hypothetical protein